MRHNGTAFTLERQPKHLQVVLAQILFPPQQVIEDPLDLNTVHQGDVRDLLPRIAYNSVALSVWSPPYFVGKTYEADLTFEDWKNLLNDTVRLHFPIIKPGGFLVINIADILCFKDPSIPRIQAEAVNSKRSSVTKIDILRAKKKYSHLNRHALAKLLGCSEQTVDRRINGNNIRGGKSESQTRVKIVGGLVEEWAVNSGFVVYDRRIWVKDCAWENSRWANLSYRSADESEYLYFLWKPGITRIDRSRLTKAEWTEWGARGVWNISSVRTNDDHEAKFPIELPLRVIRLLTEPNETVLDCFIGSGTTALAAVKENRNFIGIELNEKYVTLANKNLREMRKKLSASRS